MTRFLCSIISNMWFYYEKTDKTKWKSDFVFVWLIEWATVGQTERKEWFDYLQFFKKLSLSLDNPIYNAVIDLAKSLRHKKAKFSIVKD